MGDSQNSNKESIAGSIADEIDIWKTLFEPDFYTSLSDPFGPITLEVQYFTESPLETGEEPAEVIKVPIFPFYTMNDIKLAIYNKKNQPKFAPQFQFLAEYTEETEHYQALDAYYLEPGSKKPLSFDDPLSADKNKAFVDDGGNKKTLNFVSRSRTLYEDTYLYAKKEPILRLFLLSEIVAAKESLGNEPRYLGHIKPYFNSDYISNTTKGDTVPEEQVVELKRARNYFSAREVLLRKTIEPSVAKFAGDVNLRIEGIKSLRLVWLNITDSKTVDTLFYEQSVDLVRPFLRLLPKDSTPVTKLHVVKGGVPVPAIADPCLILQWAREKNPAPKNDFLFGKIDIGDEYATLQILDDGTAAVVVQPRKGQRQFEAESAELFRQRIQQGISGFPFAEEDPQLNEMSFQASITIKGDKIERRELSKRLEAFGSFFQEIPPPPNSPSLMSLRYKAISNFYAQDRVQLYMSQLVAIKTPPEAIITKTAEAFEITYKQAQTEYQEFVTRAEEIIPVVPKYSVFRLKYNPGIDINISARHPTYTFQIERVDSITNLQRVLTLLSVMMTYPVAKPVDKAAVATLAKAVSFDEAGEEAPKVAAPVDESKSKLSIANYFIKRLQQADPTLFGFGEGQTTQNGYGQMCQFAQMRQPAVLSEKQYRRMLELYAGNTTENEVEFVEVSYKNPVPSGDSKLTDTYATEKEIDDNTFTVLKYGTTLKDQRYYICSEYFCIEDEIPLRPSEFEQEGEFRPEANEEFQGKPKLAYHCPFCNGRLIDTKKKKDQGATVYKREKMKYVGFMNKDAHPAHWGLPCCFTKKKFTSKGKFMEFFKKQREEEKKSGPVAVEPDSEVAEVPAEEEDAYDEDADIEGINYEDVLNRTHERTVVKDTKFPLELKGGEPQLGLIPSVLDTYFHQNPDSLVTKGMTMRMKPISEGFFRIAADNRLSRRPESFFAAIAPFFKKNSATDVRLRLRELFSGPSGVKLFTSINFGNLMLEFYMPALSNEQYTAAELTRFAVKNLNPKRSQQYPYIARIKKSYDNFINFLNNPKKLKEYRQFAHLLAQPNIFMPALLDKQGNRTDRPGILFVVIEMTDDKNYTIRCPPFGVTETMDSCDIGFLIHREEIWEPLFFLKNSVDTRGFARHIHTMRVKSDNTQSPHLPAAVLEAIRTFRTQCANEAPTVYTGIQQLANPENRLPTLTELVALLSEVGTFVGVIRDVYNHVVAVTLKIDEDNEVAFPVIDDGFMQSQNSLVIYFGWEGFTPAPVEVAWTFYEENEVKFADYPGYKPQRIIRLPYGKTKAIRAIQFENGIFVPVSDANVGEDEIPGKIDDLAEIEFEWTINEKIGRPQESASDKKTGDKKTVSITKEIETENEVEEIFQHFRLSVSNWLLSKEGTPWKNKIEEIIMPPSKALGYNLSVGRKRELLQMLLVERMKQFIDTEHEPESKVPSVVRVDCRRLTQGDCAASNRCVWRPDEKRCLLHVKALPDVDKTDMTRVFLLRLIEELIRFPRRRAQILQEYKRRIGTLSKLSGAVRMIDQYIVPEDTSEWAELMNMDCKKRTPEIPHFFEEFSREEMAKPVAKAEPPAVAQPAVASSLPEFVLNLLEGDDTTYELVPFKTDRKGDQDRYDAIEYGLSIEPQEEAPFVNQDTIEEMIELFSDPKTGFAVFNDGNEIPHGVIGTSDYAYVVLYIDGAYSFLVKKGDPISPLLVETLPETLQVVLVEL